MILPIREEAFHAHAYRVTFEGAQLASGEGRNAQGQYENFFLGRDPARWGSHCAVFGEVVLHDIYPGIDLRIDGAKSLKYEFIVQPGVDPSIIRMRFDGQDGMQLVEGRLLILYHGGRCGGRGSGLLGTLLRWHRQQAHPSPFNIPVAQEHGHLRREGDQRSAVDDRPGVHLRQLYRQHGGQLLFFTATYDNDGALYGGGIVFDFGYPTTLGVLQPTFAGLDIDIGLSKWSPDGTNLEWSTYLGGNPTTKHRTAWW